MKGRDYQAFLVAILLVAQLLLVTNARTALLTGHVAVVGWLALASVLSFIVACVVIAPPRRMRGVVERSLSVCASFKDFAFGRRRHTHAVEAGV